MSVFKTKRNAAIVIPKEFTKDVIATLNRIEQNICVSGILYIRKDAMTMCTVPRGVAVILNKRLHSISHAIARAVKELDVLDELIAYRIVSKREEISVATGPEFSAAVVHSGKKAPLGINIQMKIISNLLKDAQDEKLVKTTAKINKFNPMVDRIMDDESVEGVIMTNKEGAPILTTVSVTHASLYGAILHKYSLMSTIYIKEIDPSQRIIAVRIKTRKHEIILAPDPEFLIIVIQHSRKTSKHPPRKNT